MIQPYSITQAPYNADAINLCSEKLVKENLKKSCESSFTNGHLVLQFLKLNQTLSFQHAGLMGMSTLSVTEIPSQNFTNVWIIPCIAKFTIHHGHF